MLLDHKTAVVYGAGGAIGPRSRGPTPARAPRCISRAVPGERSTRSPSASGTTAAPRTPPPPGHLDPESQSSSVSTIRPRRPPAATRSCATATCSSGRVAATRGSGWRRRERRARPAAARRCDPDVCTRVPRNGKGVTGRDRHERALVPDGVQAWHANEPGVQRAVHTGGHDASNRPAQALGASDELVGTEPADQLLVAGGGDGHGAEPAQHGELQREPAQRAGRARDQ